MNKTNLALLCWLHDQFWPKSRYYLVSDREREHNLGKYVCATLTNTTVGKTL
jgi:hypothetical protein